MTQWGVIPAIRVGDMAEALAFYCGTLEFTLDSGGDDESHSSLTRGNAHRDDRDGRGFLRRRVQRCDRQRLGKPSCIDLYMEVADLADFHARLQAAGARIVDPLAARPWGQEQFTVEVTKATG